MPLTLAQTPASRAQSGSLCATPAITVTILDKKIGKHVHDGVHYLASKPGVFDDRQ
jgi:hypothetical protein